MVRETRLPVNAYMVTTVTIFKIARDDTGK
jgi:hypothetical protein